MITFCSHVCVDTNVDVTVRSDSPRGQPWFIRAMKGNKQFWRPEDTDSVELQSTEAPTKA